MTSLLPLNAARRAPGQGRGMGRFVAQDSSFVALVDGAFADAAARSGKHLLCLPGCAQCCVGVFTIGPADSLRLAMGWQSLQQSDPEKASRIAIRARASWERLRGDFPGNPDSGILSDDAGEAFEAYGNDEVCPVLDPLLGTCDMYDARPHTCRVFGPPLKTEAGYGVCELCFTQATPDEIASAALAPTAALTPDALESAAREAGAMPGETIVAFVFGASDPKRD